MDNGPGHCPLLLQPILKEGIESPPCPGSNQNPVLMSAGSQSCSSRAPCGIAREFLISLMAFPGSKAVVKQQGELVAGDGEGIRIPAGFLLLHTVV